MVDFSNGLGLDGRVILITGAARGLGRAYAAALVGQGACVALHDAGLDKEGCNPDPCLIEALAAELSSKGGTVAGFAGLLSDAESCGRLVQQILGRFGRIDGLIHSAGLVAWQDTAAVEDDLYRRLNGINSDAAFWLASAVLPGMREQGFGRLLFTTSGWALSASPGSGPLVLYCQGKGAQFGLAMALAKDAGHPEILANALSPVANTRMYASPVPEGKLRPDRVAGAAAYLVSPACRLTGWVVKAADGDLALARIEDLANCSLGEAAEDPVAAATALSRMAEELQLEAARN